MELEYIDCFEAMKQSNWLRNLIHEMQVVKSFEKPLKIYSNNASTVFFAKNNRRSEASRLMDFKYLKVQDKVREKIIEIEHPSTYNMIPYPLTKALHVTAFQRHVISIGLQTCLDYV